MQEDGISKSFLSAGTILLFCGIILIITVLISYLGKRARPPAVPGANSEDAGCWTAAPAPRPGGSPAPADAGCGPRFPLPAIPA